MTKYKIIALLTAFLSLLAVNFGIANNTKKVGAQEAVKVGIDVSYHQGEIDWKGVKQSGVDFVMLRIGYDFSMDSKFDSYLKGAKEVGLDIGAYFYSYADSVEDAISEAKNCVKWLDKYPATFTYPIVYDAEEKKMEKFAAKACEAFAKVLTDNGYYAMIYASTSWFNSVIAPLSTISHLDFWQANYLSSYKNKTPMQLISSGLSRPKLNSYDLNVSMWQCTDSGLVKGIKGGVDVNISYVDFAQIITQEGYNGFEKSTHEKRVVVCEQSYVNVRALPTTASSIIGKVNFNEQAPLKRKVNSRWLEIDFNGKIAYVYANYFALKVEEPNDNNNGGDEENFVGGETDNNSSNQVGSSGGESFDQSDNINSEVIDKLQSDERPSGCTATISLGLTPMLLAIALVVIIKQKY